MVSTANIFVISCSLLNWS